MAAERGVTQVKSRRETQHAGAAVVGIAVGLVLVPGPTTGLFTIGLRRADIADPLTPLAAALRPYAEVHDLDTRLGRVLAIGYHQHSVRQMQVVLPLPGQGTVAVFSIATEHLAQWETYTRTW